jgi:hypothetical protein
MNAEILQLPAQEVSRLAVNWGCLLEETFTFYLASTLALL